MPWGSRWMTRWWNHHWDGTLGWAGTGRGSGFQPGTRCEPPFYGGLPGLERYMGLKFSRSGSETEVWGPLGGKMAGGFTFVQEGAFKEEEGFGAWGLGVRPWGAPTRKEAGGHGTTE